MFAIIPTHAIASLADRGRIRRFPRSCVLMRQGDFADAMYVIRQGVVDVIQTDELGVRKHVALLGEGEVVGEMGLLSGNPRSATVVAVNDVVAVRIAREDVLRGLLALPGLPQPLRLHLAKRLAQPAPPLGPDALANTGVRAYPDDDLVGEMA